jgi:PPOX class probable F420-dependent enzyme
VRLDTEQLESLFTKSAPPSLGVVGTVRRDGSPHLAPVWFRWDGTSIKIWTADSRLWVRNLVRDTRAAFSIHSDEPPYPSAVLYGAATVESGDLPSVHDEIRAITRRYVPPEEVDSYISGWPDLLTIVTISPERITSWSESE